MKRAKKTKNNGFILLSNLPYLNQIFFAKTMKIEHFTFAPVPVEIELAANEENGNAKLPTFKMTAYTGTMMSSARDCPLPLVIDLTGLEIPSQKIPVRFQHLAEYGVGHTTKVVLKETKVLAEGVISRETKYARDVVTAAQNGFPWQVSMGGPVQEYQYIAPDETVKVNGKMFKGACYVLRKMTLKEVSFVDIGADPNTSATVQLSYDQTHSQTNKEKNMPVINTQTDAPDINAPANPAPPLGPVHFEGAGADVRSEKTADVPAPKIVQTQPIVPVVNLSADDHKQLMVENRRIAAISHFGGGKRPNLEAKAIEDGWSLEKFQGEYNAKTMPDAANIQMSGDSGKGLTPTALEAVALRACGCNTKYLESQYEAKTLELADKFSGIGIQEFCELGCGGKYLPKYRRDPTGWLQAAFSTVSLPGILSNVANKTLLEGFLSMDETWRKISKIGTVNNFQKHTRYRMNGMFKFEKVGADGELKHGTLGEEQYAQQVDTFGIMFALTRQMIVNDDLGAFTDIPRSIGIGAADSISDAVWSLLLSNPKVQDNQAFFHANHKNLLAETDLDISGLTKAETLFALQERSKGRPIGIPAKYLLVPTALKVQAEILMKSLFVDGATELTGNINPHSGKYEIVSTPYLQAAAFTGNSADTWYLFADPNRISAIEVAFLGGKQQPTVERADADFNTLGVQFRGFIDFGVTAQDYRAALKVNSKSGA
jgi:hypothetical protein